MCQLKWQQAMMWRCMLTWRAWLTWYGSRLLMWLMTWF
jgi:hypothetical protein